MSARRGLWQALSSAPNRSHQARIFRVTHTFHPLCGKEFEIIELRECWGEDRLFYSDGTGCLSYIPASWTDFPAENLFRTIAAGRSRLHIDSLLQLTVLVRSMREETVK